MAPTVVADLRGQGLSDAPMEGYDLATLAADAVAVAEGSGLLRDDPIVLAGHGFGALVAAAAAEVLADRCAGLVLVDGGWERLDVTTEVDVDEFLRGLDEPPEVMRSMDAWLADRRGFDPATWDADQERLARDAVVETAAGHVVRAVRPHVVEAIVRDDVRGGPGADARRDRGAGGRAGRAGLGRQRRAPRGAAPVRGGARAPRGSRRSGSRAIRARPTT